MKLCQKILPNNLIEYQLAKNEQKILCDDNIQQYIQGASFSQGGQFVIGLTVNREAKVPGAGDCKFLQ